MTSYQIKITTLLIAIAGLFALTSCEDKWKDLIGTKWTLESIHTPHGQKLVPKQPYTLQIEKDNIILRLDVNTCRFSYEVKDKDQVEISEMGICTRACCDSDLARSFSGKLPGMKKIKIEKEKLTIIGEDTMYLRPWTEDDIVRKDKSEYLKIRRTGCFGKCPIYEMTLYPDGNAEYRGQRFVEVEGNQSYTFDQETVDKLFTRAKRLDFKSLPPAYDNPQISDMESVFIEYNGTSVKVRERRDVPEALMQLINDMHELTVNVGWVRPQ